jgi:hypothetical protein
MSGPRAPHWLRHKPQRTPLKFEGPLWVRSDASAPASVEYDEVPVPAFAHKAAEVKADDLSNARMRAV